MNLGCSAQESMLLTCRLTISLIFSEVHFASEFLQYTTDLSGLYILKNVPITPLIVSSWRKLIRNQTNKKTLSFCIYKRESQGFIKYLEHHTEGWAQEIKPMKLCMKHWIHPNFHMHWYYLNNHNKYCDNWPTSMTEGEHRWCETRADLKINEKNMKNKLILKSQPIERW